MSESTLIAVDLAGNDDNGNWSGTIEAVTIDYLCQLEGDALACTDPTQRTVTIGGIALTSHGHIPWHGNMAWEAIRVSITDVCRLLAYLRTQHWTILEGDARIFAAYDNGEPITTELLERCL